MTTTKLRALTLRPEWAWAICHLDKRVENRPERVARMVLNVVGDGWLAIHAGAHVGGRPGYAAERDGKAAVLGAAVVAGWCITTNAAMTPQPTYLHSPYYPTIGPEWVRFGWMESSAIVALCRVGPGDRTSRWAVPGQAQIGLRDLFVLPEPVPCGGKQGLWTVPDDVAERVLSQVPRE